MGKKLIVALFIFLTTLTLPIKADVDEDELYITKAKQDLLTLMLAYPDSIVSLEKDSNNLIYCVMKSGTKIVYDDKTPKNLNEKINNPDLHDMLEQIYPLTKCNKIAEKNFDPGRIRHYTFLNEVYGKNQKEIEANLKSLEYGYTNYQFNSKNRANTSLETSLRELIPLSKERNDINSILFPASGTYNYRLISGTNRLSPHSYGIAIDLKSDSRDYWKWTTVDKGEERLCEYPDDLVAIFEKNNFIWGGKWNHFDILHFEYRPEIILKSKYFSNWDSTKEWYAGAPLEYECTQNYIEIIEKTLN